MSDKRACTCHPEDAPPIPCPHKYALSDCRAAAAQYRAFVDRCNRVTDREIEDLEIRRAFPPVPESRKEIG